MAKQALGQDVLLRTRHPDNPPTFSHTDHRLTDPCSTMDVLRDVTDRMAPVRARFGDSSTALARIALRYALQHAPDSIVLVGFRDAEQIRTDITCLGDPLTDDEIIDIRAVLHPDTRKVA